MSRRNSWLLAFIDDTDLLLGLGEPALPKGSFDRLIRLSADWPPHSSFDLEMFAAKSKHSLLAVEYVLKKYADL